MTDGGCGTQIALQKIKEAEGLLDQIDGLGGRGVEGAAKLRRRVEAEVKFLQKSVESGREVKEEHVLCSNLGQLGALVQVALSLTTVCGVLQTFPVQGREEKIVVDVVADDGRKWVKVIMRNPKALHVLFVSRGRDGTKPLDLVAEDFLAAAHQHPILYSIPQIVFWFCRGVSAGLAKSLEDRGVQVVGDRIPDGQLGLPDFAAPDSDSDSSYDELSSDEADYDIEEEERERSATSDDYSPALSLHETEDLETERGDDGSDDQLSSLRENYSDLSLVNSYRTTDAAQPSPSCSATDSSAKLSDKDRPKASEASPKLSDTERDRVPEGSAAQINVLNLDVTAMIAYVSATTNGGANYTFTDKFLNEQAAWERESPVKERLNNYFCGKELVACQEAVDHFLHIVATIGGEGERARATTLVSRLRLVPGLDHFKDRLRQGGKVRDLSRLIFGTGHVHRAITVTSNRGLVRSAQQQGINLAVYFHSPRALTEAKEATATPMQHPPQQLHLECVPAEAV